MAKVKDETSTENQTTTLLNFELKLPPEIDVKPWMVVDLPRNKQALIYQVQRPRESRPGYADSVTLGLKVSYDCYIVSKKTMARSTDGYSHRSCVSFDDVPALKHHLHNTAVYLSSKRKTIKKVNVVDLQDDDDD